MRKKAAAQRVNPGRNNLVIRTPSMPHAVSLSFARDGIPLARLLVGLRGGLGSADVVDTDSLPIWITPN